MPKSSIESRTPSALSSRRRASVAWLSSTSAVSVISSVSRPGSTPDAASASPHLRDQIGSLSCHGERLTAMRRERRPSSSCQRRTCRQACVEDEIADRDDESGLLRDLDEPVRLHEAPRVGCSQRTRASVPTMRSVCDLDDRLVVDDELVALDGAAQLVGELEPLVDGRLHRGLEDLQAVLAVRLGRVHGDVGVAQQLLAERVRSVGHGDADADRDGEVRSRSSQKSSSKRREDALRDIGTRRRGSFDPLEEDGELVAAQPRGGVAGAQDTRRAAPRPGPADCRPARGRSCR